jgi:hypothetical protein
MLPAGERVGTGEMPIAITFVKYAYTAAANRKGIFPPLASADKIQYVHMEVLDAKAF